MDTIFVTSDLDRVLPEFSRYNTFSFDLETTGLNPIDSGILLAQIAFPEKAFVIDTSRVDLHPLMPYFKSPHWMKIIQNAKFDTKFLLQYYKTKTNNVFDTKLAENVILGNESYSGTGLKALALKYLNVTLDKDIRESFINMHPIEAFSEDQIKYAAKDVEVLFGIKEAQEAKIREYGLEKVSKLEFELASVVGSMELAGVPIDKKKWAQILEQTKKEHEKARLKMHEELFDKGGLDEQLGMFERGAINLNSVPQIKKAFKKLGIDIEKTDERELSKINHPAARAMLEYRKLQKIVSAYGESFLDKIHPFTGRIHADFNQYGTATGRFSCKDPNLQQMPPDFRKCVGLPDYHIVGADFSNIELRILAEVSEDDALLEAFNSGDDPHKSTAALMFGIPIDKVTKDERFISKTINFGIAYGMGSYKLMDMLNKPTEDKPKGQNLGLKKVDDMMRRYKETYHKANRWLQNAGNLAYRQSFSTTMYGRKRWFDRPNNGDPNWENEVASIKRQGANAVIQGTNADITKIAMLNLYEDLKNYNLDAEIILQVHDEIGVLSHKSNSEIVRSVVVESMEKSAQEIIRNVPIKVDSYVGEYWNK